MSRKINWSGRGHAYSQVEIIAAMEAMENSDPLTQGRHLLDFEKKFREYLGVDYSFAVANCTNALDLASLLCCLGPGDEVIVPAHTFCATAIPFARTGAVIKWADIDPLTRVVSLETIKKVCTSKTKLIVVVHLYGLMAPMPEIMMFAQEKNIAVVEDCAQAIGAAIDGRLAGTYGDYACFSFHGAKNMSTLGEGGMLVVRSKEKADLVPGLRHNGCCSYPENREHYWKPAMSNVGSDIDGIWPYNFCLGEIQCAVGAKLLDRIDIMAEERAVRANKFINSLRSYSELCFQAVPDGYRHVYHLLTAKFDGKQGDRDHFIEIMWNRHGVKVIVQYCPLYRYPLFQANGFGEAECPHTDHFFDNMVSFPFHHWMADEDFDYMIEATRATLEEIK